MGVPLGRSLPKILRHRIYPYYHPRLFLSTNNRYSRQSVGRASHTLRCRPTLPTLSHFLSISHKESHGITWGVQSSVRYRSQQKLLIPAWLTAFRRRYRYLEVGWVRIRHGLLSENIQAIRAVEISRVKNPKRNGQFTLPSARANSSSSSLQNAISFVAYTRTQESECTSPCLSLES